MPFNPLKEKQRLKILGVSDTQMSYGHEQNYELSCPPASGKLGPVYMKAVPRSFCFNLSKGNGPGLG